LNGSLSGSLALESRGFAGKMQNSACHMAAFFENPRLSPLQVINA
jgi:hypothetical protein